MGDDAYMDMCANTFRRAAEGFLDRRRKRRRVRRASAAVLVMALIPTGGVLAAQEAPTQVVDVELLDDGSAAWVEIEAGADADEVLDDLRELVRELDLGLDVREISGPPEFVGQLYVDDEASPPWRTATRLDGDTLAVSVVVAAHPDEVYGTLGQHNDWCALHGKTVAEVKASVPSDVDIRWSVAGGARGVRDDALVLQLTEVGPGQLVGLMSTDQLDPVPCR